MEIWRCLQVLELEECSSMDAVRSAYRDLVRVWHPDRFTGDPRLKKLAEERVKRLNTAYETLIKHLEQLEGADIKEASGANEFVKHGLSSTEVFFEAGTRKVLTMCYSLGRAFRSALREARKKEKIKRP